MLDSSSASSTVIIVRGRAMLGSSSASSTVIIVLGRGHARWLQCVIDSYYSVRGGAMLGGSSASSTVIIVRGGATLGGSSASSTVIVVLGAGPRSVAPVCHRQLLKLGLFFSYSSHRFSPAQKILNTEFVKNCLTV